LEWNLVGIGVGRVWCVRSQCAAEVGSGNENHSRPMATMALGFDVVIERNKLKRGEVNV
jgi:hypothetical protein